VISSQKIGVLAVLGVLRPSAWLRTTLSLSNGRRLVP
jgi:hypothetical protein